MARIKGSKNVKTKIQKGPVAKSENIFDLSNLDDLPAKLRTAAEVASKKRIADRLLDLFEMKPILSIGEMLIGFYRLHGIETTKGNLNSALSIMYKRGLIDRDANIKGVYRRAK